MFRRSTVRLSAFALSLGASLSAGPVLAQSGPSQNVAPTSPARAPAAAEGPTAEELAAARELWTTGLELEKSKDWAGALDKFTKVGQVRMTPQVRYHIAFSSEHLGKLVDALNGYQLAIQEARALGDKARDVAENTPPRLDAVRVRVAKVRIHVEGKLRSSQLMLDGKKLSRALLDHDIPVDPGKHVLEVRREGAVLDTKTVTVAEGGSDAVSFTVSDPIDLDPAPETDEPVAPPVVVAPKVESSSRAPAYIVGGAGLALAATGGAFWALRESTIANIRATCTSGDTGCDPNFTPTEDLGRTYTTVARVLFGAGGAAFATGVTLFFVLAPEEEDGPKAPETKPTVAVAPTLGGAVVHGTF